MTADSWKPPGPGSWKLDVTHFRAPVERIQEQAFSRGLDDAFRQSFADCGIVLDILFMPVPSGWYYARAVPVAPEQMPARIVAATRTLETRPWRHVPARWRDEQRPAFVARIKELQRQDPSTLDDTALGEHLQQAERLVCDGFSMHLVNFTYVAIAVGDWLAQGAGWARVPPWEIVETLAGYSPGSTATRVWLHELADAVRASPESRALFDGGTPTLDALRASSASVAAAVDRYVEEYGFRTVSGFHVSDVTLREEPQLLVEALAATLEDHGNRPALEQQSDAAAARLRERVAPEHREAFDRSLAEARAVYGSNDVDVVVLLFWPLGLLRRAALAAGERLRAKGRVGAREHVFDATVEEAKALLAGVETTPSATELAARHEQRLAYGKMNAPTFIGDPPEPPPPPGVLPAPVERVTNAFGLAWSLIDEDGQPRAQVAAPPRGLLGHAASAGVYEGVARVIHGPEDFGKLRRGDVLVTRTTSPTYNVVLPMIGAIVTERGGALCHAAVVSREFGIPAVVGTGTATRDIPSGARVRVDGTNGVVTVLD